ncbi:hypothetical protein Goarm_014171, partial [Gossypium armourianum]|nr:hypothetical protein [Gossypium armourianum]
SAIETFGVKTPKLKLTWTIKEEKLTNANLKALYSIFSGVDGQEFKRISKFTTTKEAWDILDTTCNDPFFAGVEKFDFGLDLLSQVILTS